MALLITCLPFLLHHFRRHLSLHHHFHEGGQGFGALSEAVELTEASFRELEHSCGGGFTQSVLEPHAHDWLAAYSGGSRLAALEVYGPSLVGQCSLVVVSADRAEGLASSLSAAIEGRPGTRAVVVVRDTDVPRWRVALGETRGDVIWRDLSGWSALACGHRVAAEGPHLSSRTCCTGSCASFHGRRTR